MKYEKNRKILGMDDVKFQKMARILIIPVIIIVLVVVILIADRKPEDGNKAASATVASAATAISAESGNKTAETTVGQDVSGETLDENVYVSNFDDYGLQQNAVPVVNEVVAKYQRAKVTGDAALLYEVFNREQDEDFESMSASLQEEKEVYESYDHTTCYTTAGCEEDSYLVYIACDLKFAGIDTAAPMLTWAYVYKAEDGNYYMKEPDKLSEEEQELLEKVSASEDVKVLDTDMRQRLAQAVVSDAKLGTLYQMWSDTGETATPSETQEQEIVIGAE